MVIVEQVDFETEPVVEARSRWVLGCFHRVRVDRCSWKALFVHVGSKTFSQQLYAD